MTDIKHKGIGRYPALQSWIDDFWGTTKMLSDQVLNRTNLPAVNILETDTTFELNVVAPGMKKSDFTISLDEGVIGIHAEHVEKEEKNEKRYTLREYSSSSFSRSFKLPTNVKEDGVKAEYNEGLLTISLKKIPTDKPKKNLVKIS